MKFLCDPPPLLTARQRLIVWLTTALVALTRVYALSRTLWDWDEAQFCLAVRSYDVALHQPHPPGFPLYIAVAKALKSLGLSDFHALQAIVLTSAIVLFPLVFFFARELRFPFRTAYLGALLTVFLPNVWFFGGTAFSDVPGLALTVGAAALLLRGCRDRRSYFAGALVLGLAAAMRPQALIVGFVPAVLASWCRRKRWSDVAAATSIGAAVIALAYAGAALASSSVADYLTTTAELRRYLRDKDSFLSPERPPLLQVLNTFFVHPFPGGRLALALAAGALAAIVASLIRKAPRVWLLLAVFLPFNLFGWLMLDVFSISRYSVGFAPMYALLAAEGVAAFASFAGGAAAVLEIALLLAFTVRYAVWTRPALSEVRRSVAPPVAAMQFIRTLPPSTTHVWVHKGMHPWMRYFLGGYDTHEILSAADLPKRPLTGNDWYVAEESSMSTDARKFIRPRGRIFDIARQRYFEISVEPASDIAAFGDGWYGDEWFEAVAWKWMGPRSVLLLPPIENPAHLSLVFDVTGASVAKKAGIEVQLNGKVIDRIVPEANSTTRQWLVESRRDEANELVLTAPDLVKPETDDTRDLRLRLNGYSWRTAMRP